LIQRNLLKLHTAI